MTFRRLAVAASCLVGASACAVSSAPSDQLPQWLAAKIHEFESPATSNPPPLVARYNYDGAVVYYIAPRCCDIYSELYSARGALLCHPDGGIAGTGDDRCPDFFDRRRDELIVWRHPSAST